MANPDPKISVIIPVKGDWPHLEACVRSILNLNYLNFDIIVVNDGLSDKAIISLEKYINKIVGRSLPMSQMIQWQTNKNV